MTRHYRTAVVETTEEPIVCAVAVADIFDNYVVYESPEGWQVACGTAAEVVVGPRTVRCVYDGQTVETPWEGDPLVPVRRFLNELPLAGWRAYGWCAFELGAALAGLEPADEVLAHLLVPAVEVRLQGSHATVRSLTAEDLDTVERRLADPTSQPRRPAGRASVDLAAATDEYQEAVASVVRDINAGKLEKAVLSRVVGVPEKIDFPASFMAGRRRNTPARSFLLAMSGLQVFGFSPEIVLRVDADGTLVSQPLAGTRALSGDAETDVRLRRQLLTDAKEIHEHAISVRTAVEELHGSCRPDTVAVSEFMTVKERGSVQHLGSQVTGRLAEGRDAWSALAAVFPAVTASGVPKRAAYEAIGRLESQRRGPYAGAVVTVDADGSMDAALVLRSAYSRDGVTWLRAGAGVVGQSRPERELEETCEKLGCIAGYLVISEG
ncbi:salicylate synthase [Micromonospora sp. WMMD735]|uniref:salicylate synthase n=1 Tax=Micromonospora sp. WMMD735 TaxID=3404130 RepID=UPI003B92D04F